jgi:integrase/recombinase XerD
MLALDLEQVDLKQQKFQVIGKGNKQRWCFYSDDAAQLLTQYLKHYRHHSCAALFTAYQPIAGTLSRLSYRTIHQNWRQLIADTPELAGARLHDLRHTFATERVGLMGIEEHCNAFSLMARFRNSRGRRPGQFVTKKVDL